MTTQERAENWGEWFGCVVRRAGAAFARRLRDVMYGIDTWSSITHGVEPRRKD